MTRDALRRLELLNQLSLTDKQAEDIISFFAAREADAAALEIIDTDNTERMVHVLPILTVVRDDVVVKNFSREALQDGAPDTDAGYWCVPRVLE